MAVAGQNAVVLKSLLHTFITAGGSQGAEGTRASGIPHQTPQSVLGRCPVPQAGGPAEERAARTLLRWAQPC